MKSGSICVGAGEGVHTGQVIGDLGFSGDTTAPHLHLHVADGANPLEDALLFVIALTQSSDDTKVSRIWGKRLATSDG
jgi:murein DD-endopeptidase MepM/ murein hydrolase activator NlpD